MAIRLLEVSVSAVDPVRWKWCVLSGINEIAAGFESSRETAQREGDAALFQLLTMPPNDKL
jgi:hypothetical protein